MALGAHEAGKYSAMMSQLSRTSLQRASQETTRMRQDRIEMTMTLLQIQW